MTPQNFLEAFDKTIEMYGGTGPDTPTFFRPGNMILVNTVHQLLKQIRAQIVTLPCFEQGGIAEELRLQDNKPNPPTTMTKEEFREYVNREDKRLHVLRAALEGKVIQYLSNSGWIDIDLNQQDINALPLFLNDIRIKPEPHYRPFKDRDEFFAAAEKHGFWIEKDFNVPDIDPRWILPGNITDGCFAYIDVYGKADRMSYLNLVNTCVWKDDNTPCGVPTDSDQ